MYWSFKCLQCCCFSSCWLSDYDSPEVNKINDRISAITGLTMDTAEELQIANYGIGGQYEPHFDFARVS